MADTIEALMIDSEAIARAAGELIMGMMQQSRRITYKSTRDMVTEVDQASEAYIVGEIQKRYPQHAILAEEGSGYGKQGAAYCWIIDPLDGTTNFVHGFPVFAVSIGVEYKGELMAGAVYNPVMDECFSAGNDRGAFLNGEKISVSSTPNLGGSILATGFPYFNDDYFDLNMDLWTSIYGKTQGLRRAGAAAIDLAWVACGRLDGYWEFSLKPWDMAAGALIVREAGGIVTGPRGETLALDSGNLIAANPELHGHLLLEVKDIMDKRVTRS